MFKGIIKIVIVLLLVPAGLKAQKTMAVSDPVSHYNRALSLFDKEQYGSAIAELEEF